MKVLETAIAIAASPQTVWSILDDIERYPDWNPTVPEFSGRTTVDGRVQVRLIQPETPDLHIEPTIIRIIAARELRWISYGPTPEMLSAEHIFILEPTANGGCHLIHKEIFNGSLVDQMWPGIRVNGKNAYEAMNAALKMRAEQATVATIKLHPAAEAKASQPQTTRHLTGGTLRCLCASDTVVVKITEPSQHNHLCGCSKCWKPAGASFAQVAVVPKGTLNVVAQANKLRVVDAAQSIKRHACTACGAHMYGRVEDADHHFYGIDFIHPELSSDAIATPPAFAAFVSSIIESGADSSHMQALRARLRGLGIPAYDAFSPELMDVIAYHKVKLTKLRHVT